MKIKARLPEDFDKLRTEKMSETVNIHYIIFEYELDLSIATRYLNKTHSTFDVR